MQGQSWGRHAQVVCAEAPGGQGAPQPAMLMTNATVHPGEHACMLFPPPMQGPAQCRHSLTGCLMHHAGASGGAVLDRDGSLIGLVTSNARHSSSGAVLPGLNFCLAAAALQPLWELLAAAAAQDMPQGTLRRRLGELDVSSEALSQIWALRGRMGRAPEEDAQARMRRLLRQRGVADAPSDRTVAAQSRL